MLRSRIEPNTSTTSGEIQMMQLAQAMGVTIFSTPWSPPAQYKSNDDTSNGGYLLPAYYQTYADELAQYVINMRNQNPSITVSAVSLQNEPDYTASYESCTYTAAQLAAFLPYVYNAFAAAGLTTKIILPEETGWHWELASTIMGSPTLSAEVGIYADHDYDGGSGPIPVTLNSGQQVWETEIYDSSGTNTDITSGIWTATNIYNMLITSRANAWNYWWIYSSGSGGLLGQDWQTTKRFWAAANYSKFVRPGWVDVGESDDGGMLISAFKSPTTGELATVLVNSSSSPITETVNLNGAYAPVLMPWVTSATLDLAPQQPLPATGNGSSFSYTVPADSIVTLDGFASTTPLTQVPVGLLATASSTSAIQLSWTNNLTGATGYTVQRSPDGTNWTTLSNSLSASTYSYTDSGLPENTLYYYRVIANNAAVYSNVSTAMTQPKTPSNLTATYNASTQNVSLSWTGNSSAATDYAIDESTNGGATWTEVYADIQSGTTSFTDTAAPQMATVLYRVREIYPGPTPRPRRTLSL